MSSYERYKSAHARARTLEAAKACERKGNYSRARMRDALMVRECLRETFTADSRADARPASAQHTPRWAKTPRTKHDGAR